jgi:hypothetical protein
MTAGVRVGETTDARMWDGGRVEVRRRQRRLGPGAIALSLVMILAAFLFVALPLPVLASGPVTQSPDCIPCPGGGGKCEPNCGGGCNPTYVPVDISNIRVTAEATNTSVSWSESPGAQSTTFYWGNSPSYSYSQSAGSWSVFLSYLDPDTLYYYEIYAHEPTGSGCGTIYTSNSHTGSWITSFENVSSSYQYAQTLISGYVFNSAGSPAPSGLGVYLTCARPGGAAYADWDNYGWTQSGGYFSVSTDPGVGTGIPFCDQVGSQYTGFAVQVENGFGVATKTWAGYWNETIVVWDVQDVDFVLPSNIISNPVVQIADYSNANESNGFPNSHLSYQKDVSYRDTASGCYELFGFIQYGCFSTVYASAATSKYSVTGSNLIVTQRYVTSGTVVFDSYNRGSNVTQVHYVGTDGPPVLEGPSYPVDSTIGPNTAGAYPLYHWGGSGSGQGVPVYLNSPKKDSVTINATKYSNWTNDYTLLLPIPVGEIIDWIVEGLSEGQIDPGLEFEVEAPIFTTNFAEQAVSSWSVGLNWTLSGNSATVPTCYAVYGVGGSSSSSSTTADAVGIWAYGPRYVEGVYSCPLP